MTEETEQSQDKKSALKKKLKDMGVMENENAPAKNHETFLTRNKMPIMFFVIVISVLVWWSYHKNYQDRYEVAGQTATTMPYMMGDPYAPPPPPPGYFPRRERADIPDVQPPSGWGTPPDWKKSMTRRDDVYGPMPGPLPPGYMYGRPYGYYSPPPPPAYFGPYGPYGPAPFYGYPGYGGY